MFLILLLVGVAFLAYYLAKRDYDKRTMEATRGLTDQAKKAGGDLQGKVKYVTGQSQGKPEDFIAWATGPGKKDLPDDFNTWFASLDNAEKKSFSKALANYVDSLGMSLAALTSGRLNTQPDFKSVFVETLVIYSSAYRKIADAKANPEKNPDQAEAEKETPKTGEIKAAEKAPSRRSAEPQIEPAPAAT